MKIVGTRFSCVAHANTESGFNPIGQPDIKLFTSGASCSSYLSSYPVTTRPFAQNSRRSEKLQIALKSLIFLLRLAAVKESPNVDQLEKQLSPTVGSFSAQSNSSTPRGENVCDHSIKNWRRTESTLGEKKRWGKRAKKSGGISAAGPKEIASANEGAMGRKKEKCRLEVANLGALCVGYIRALLDINTYFLQADAKYFSAKPTAENPKNRCAERIENSDMREMWNKDQAKD